MNNALQIPTLMPVIPETLLVVGAMALLMLGVFRGKGSIGVISGLAVLILVAAGVLIVLEPEGRVIAFGGSFVSDGFARFLKVLALIGSAGTILLSTASSAGRAPNASSFRSSSCVATPACWCWSRPTTSSCSISGSMLMSLSLYVIAAIDRDNVRSTEAGLKYFVLARSPRACCSTAAR